MPPLKKKVLQRTVVIHSAKKGGFWIEVPTLPGCHTQGETIEEALKMTEEAITLYLESFPVEQLKDIRLARAEVKNRKVISQDVLFRKLKI